MLQHAALSDDGTGPMTRTNDHNDDGNDMFGIGGGIKIKAGICIAQRHLALYGVKLSGGGIGAVTRNDDHDADGNDAFGIGGGIE